MYPILFPHSHSSVSNVCRTVGWALQRSQLLHSLSLFTSIVLSRSPHRWLVNSNGASNSGGGYTAACLKEVAKENLLLAVSSQYSEDTEVA
jgi:hypothetical protein